MEAFGAIVRRLIQDYGIEKPIRRCRALQIWPDAVGDRIASVTEPQRISDGKLFIKVKNASWRNELIFYKPDILKKLNDSLGSHIIEDIIYI